MTDATETAKYEKVMPRTGARDLKRIVYTADEIAAQVRRMGEEITANYPEGESLLVLGLLKGSFIFLGDLVRHISRPLHVDFLVASSYVGTESTGEVDLLYDPKAPIEDRHVVLVEDIVDTGNTLNQTGDALLERDPASLEVCALLHKHVAEDLRYDPRWVGFDAPSDFLVGYGLDHAEDFRHLPFIASI